MQSTVFRRAIFEYTKSTERLSSKMLLNTFTTPKAKTLETSIESQ